jgi:hypothetical protein
MTPKTAPGATPAAPQSNTTKSGARLSASDFIRANPQLTPNDVVEAGRKQGIKFSRNLVYLVRGPRSGKSTGPKAGAKRGKKARKAKRSRKSSPAAAVAAVAPRLADGKRRDGLTSRESEFLQIALGLGVRRASELLGILEQRVRSLAL